MPTYSSRRYPVSPSVPPLSSIDAQLCTRELNDCYCLNLPSNPSLQRGSESPLLEHGKGRLVLVGASHTSRMSALIPASLETKFLQLPGQSQTKDGVGNILAAIDELKLQKGDFLCMDLLSNASFMGTDEDGLQVPPVKDGQKRWHMTGSLVACPKPRIKKILSLFDSLRKIAGDATMVCGLPLPRYTSTRSAASTKTTLKISATMITARSSARQARPPGPV